MNKKMVHYSNKNIVIDSEITKHYIELVNKMNKIKKELDTIESTLDKELKPIMEKLDTKTFNSNGLKVTLKDSYIRQSLDTTRLKTDNIDLYNSYLKQITIDSKIMIAIDK